MHTTTSLINPLHIHTQRILVLKAIRYQTLQINFVVEGRVSNGNLAQFCFQTQKLTAHAHQRRTNRIQHPPADGRGKRAVVPPANYQMDEVERHAEIQTELGAAHYEPQQTRTAQGVEYECEYYQPSTNVGDVNFLTGKIRKWLFLIHRCINVSI